MISAVSDLKKNTTTLIYLLFVSNYFKTSWSMKLYKEQIIIHKLKQLLSAVYIYSKLHIQTIQITYSSAPTMS